MTTVLVLMCCWAQASAALEVIVDRSKDSIELFLRIEGPQLTPVFDVGSDTVLRDDSGNLLTPVFQLEGSEPQATALISNVTTKVGNAEVTFQPMSMMVHPNTLQIPFSEPFDGWSYMSACTVVPPSGSVADSDLQLVAGYSVYPVDGTDPLTITLAGAEPTEIHVMEFFEGEQISNTRLSASPSDQILIEGVKMSGVLPRWLLIGLCLFALVSAIWNRRNKFYSAERFTR